MTDKCDICGSTAIDHTELKCSVNMSESRTRWAFKTVAVNEVEKARSDEQAIRVDERSKVLEEVKEWAERKRIVNTSGGFGHHMHNAVLAELRAKLVEMKGTDAIS